VIRVIASEFDKMRTTRTFFAFIIAALLLALLPTILVGALVNFGPDDDGPLEVLLFFIGGLVQVFALILGILAATTEFRHGTITPTLLIVPNRIQLMLAKLIAAMLVGFGLGLVVTGLIVLITVALGSARDFDTSGDKFALILGGSLACALFAALGVGLGALVRNQVGAIVGSLVYLLVLEPLIGALMTLSDALEDIMPKYSLGAVGNWLAGVSPDTEVLLGQVSAGLLLALYAAIFLAAGIFLVRRRDVTA
jgi:ABC-2 type transport system permease protein